MEDGRMEVSTEGLIRNLETIRNKLNENDLLTMEEDFTISVLIAHLEELKEGE